MVQNMISFKQFLLENDSLDLERFKKDCAFFLKNIQGGSELLWRGTDMPQDFEVRNFAERTRTLDTPKDIHAYLNAYYRERIGQPIRNWLFCTGNRRFAGEYSADGPSLIFPIGEFEWFCFKDKSLKDLWFYIDNLQRAIAEVISDENKAKFELYRLLEEGLDAAEFWYNEDFNTCLNSGNEIMIKCKSYYIFNPKGLARWSRPFDKSTFSEVIFPYLRDEVLNIKAGHEYFFTK